MSDDFSPAGAVKTIKRGAGSFQYLQVKDRVRWFREDHADGVIQTELLQWDVAAGYAVCRATVTIPSTGGVGVGLGSACRGDLKAKADRKAVQPDQVESWVEFAETAAIGRALARVGYGTEEALDEAGPVDSPREVAGASPATAAASADDLDDLPDPAAVRPETLRQIRALLPSAGLDEAALCVRLDISALTTLPAVRALKVVDWLKAQAKKKAQAAA